MKFKVLEIKTKKAKNNHSTHSLIKAECKSWFFRPQIRYFIKCDSIDYVDYVDYETEKILSFDDWKKMNAAIAVFKHKQLFKDMPPAELPLEKIVNPDFRGNFREDAGLERYGSKLFRN